MLCQNCPKRRTCKSPCFELEADLQRYSKPQKRLETPFSPDEISLLLETGVAEPFWKSESSSDYEVERAVESLPLNQRQIIRFVYWHGLSQYAVAELLGMSRGAVSIHIARAKATLRKKLSRISKKRKYEPSQDFKETTPKHVIQTA